MRKKSTTKDLGYFIVIILLIMGSVWLITSLSKPPKLTYAEMYDEFRRGNVEEFTLVGKNLQLELYKGGHRECDLYSFEVFREDLSELYLSQYEEGVIKKFNLDEGLVLPGWLIIVPYLLVIVLFIALWFFMFNRGGNEGKTMKFGRARTRLGSDEKRKVTFADVAGADEEKEELREIVDFLRHPKHFIDIGARIPKGVLLVGQPGTGKTLIARAVAGEAGVHFLSISGSDFVELYVGVGASRVRDLFEQAKKGAPTIVFIDEIDAVGRHRGAGMGGGHDEREQTLNQLLVEMDGFGNNEGVIIVAATNRPDILDPALLRPGRFDRQVFIGLPDIKGREAILAVHAKGKVLDMEVSLATLAKKTPGFTGADLENVLNEAALLAARRNRKAIRNDDLHDAMLKVIAGPEKKSRVITDHDKRITAYHEAGHAVTTKFLKYHDPVHQISIIPRGMASGMTIFLPEKDKTHISKKEMFERMVSSLGGRVAEQLVLDDISTGASEDIKQVTNTARKMVTKYGMSEKIGPVNYSGENEEVFLGRDYGHARQFSEAMAAAIDEEVMGFINKAYRRCEEILKEHMDALHKIAAYLLENETMDGETFEAQFAG